MLERMTPRYRATATVVVSPTSPRIMADVKEIMDLPDGGRRDFQEYAETQLDIIRSQTVAAMVLDSLDLWSDERLFKKKDDADEEEEESVDVLRLKRSTALARRIQAARIPASLIIQVSFEHEDAELAARIANEIADAYVRHNLSLKRRVLDRAGNELKALLGERLAAKDGAEAAAREFEEKHNISAVGTRQKEVEGERAFYNQKVLESTGKVIHAQAELSRMEKVKRHGIYGVGVAEVLGNQVLNSLKVNYTQIKNEVAELELVYGRKHNKLIGAKRRLKYVKSAIRQEIKGILQTATSSADAAEAAMTSFEEKFQNARVEDEALGKAVEVYGQLQKELKEQTTMYDRIRKRYEETVITTSLTEAANNVRTLDRALIPHIAVWPRRTMILVASAALGLLMSMLLIGLLERADTTIRDKEHAEEILGIPCLGLVPTIKDDSALPALENTRRRDLFVFENSLSEAAEQARTLRTNLLFLSAERKLKTLVVTSALPQEGKTTISIQVGITLAAAGGRTVLVEADMRRPRLATTLGVSNERGLSLFLADRDADISQVIQESAVPNLDVIVCGLIPPNPAELLNSLRLNQLIIKLAEQYDMIIIDSPPVNAVSDALVMASRVDGVLLVAKSKRTTSEALRTAYRSLSNVDAPIIGTVLNDMQRGSFGYYYRGRYYRKGYYRRLPEELEEQEAMLDDVEVG